MITLISGVPGTGKTATVVSLLLEQLSGSGRPIFCFNVNGLQIPHTPLTDPALWHLECPDGSVVIIDEVQDVWRPRGPGQKVPDHIAKLETHRHRGIDFFLTTQGPNLLDANVRALVGRHIHLRDIGFLGRYWYEWPECADNCRVGWKNAPLKKKFKLPKKVFDLYKSSSLHTKPIRSFPKMAIVAVLAVAALAFLGYRSFGVISSKISPPAAVAVVPGAVPPGAGFGAPGAPAVKRAPDELKDFVPRAPGRPWTAPAYDGLRVVVNMPVITGAICVNHLCRCFHQKLLIQGVSSAACAAWAAAPAFNPYLVDPEPVQDHRERERAPVVASAR